MAKRKHDQIAAEGAVKAETGDVDMDGEGGVEAEGKVDKKQKRERVNTTVFVQSLPYETTSTDLITHFSFIGPVKTGFVVVDRASGESKGVGYITYTEKSDADSAVSQLHNQPFGAGTRKIRVTLADVKPSRKERSGMGGLSFVEDADQGEGDLPALPGQKVGRGAVASGSGLKKPTQPRGVKSGANDPNAIRTLVLSGIPSSVDKSTLWKRVRKISGLAGGVNDCLLYPVNPNATQSSPGVGVGFNQALGNVAQILFESHKAAVEGIGKLHAHTFKGVLLSCVLKKRMDAVQLGGEGKKGESSGTTGEGAVDGEEVKPPVEAAGGKANRAGRLIIRNLPWTATPETLRRIFLPFGPILSIDVPITASKLPIKDPLHPPAPRARGFAFVWFLSRNDAERARGEMDGREYRVPEVVVGGVKSVKTLKKERQRERRRLRELEGELEGDVTMDGEDDGEDVKDEKEEEVKAPVVEGRKMAVDWAVSKDKYEETKKDEPPRTFENPKAAVEESDDEDEEDSDDDEDGSSGDEEVDEDGEKPVKPALPAVEEGSTLFVRNLPFEVTEDELRNLFRTFGPLRYAKITMDRETGRSRGTGFACFWKTEDADKVLEEANRVNEITGSNAIDLNAPKNPFAMPSVLTIDPSSGAASRLVLHGRTLDVVRALRREDAALKKEDGERARLKGDKRNTYLMREGVIFPNTPAARGLPEVEVEKRNTSFVTRRKLLESNPSLYISKTRLSIRQIPLYATERTLKRLGIHAVREFDKEVEAGDREGLSREEEMDGEMSPALSAVGSKGKKRGERSTAIIQSKILRQTDRVDALTGLGKSKGYGFLEMRSHKEALKALRWANNNPEVGKLLQEWVQVELTELEERTKVKVVAAREAKDANLEEMELKYKKLQAKVKEGVHGLKDEMKSGKTLLIEFSVENVQVVKRRVEKVGQVRTEGGSAKSSNNNKKRKAPDANAVADSSDDEKPSASKGNARNGKGKKDNRNGDSNKKRKVEPKGEKKGESEGAESKAGKSIGGLIGKKRRERKGKAGK